MTPLIYVLWGELGGLGVDGDAEAEDPEGVP